LLIALEVLENGRTDAAVSAAIWEIENRFRKAARTVHSVTPGEIIDVL